MNELPPLPGPDAVPPGMTIPGSLEAALMAAREECGDYFLKTFFRFNTACFHVDLIRVENLPDGNQGVPPAAPAEVHRLYEAMQAYYDGPYETVRLPAPGHNEALRPGRYAMFVYPFCE